MFSSEDGWLAEFFLKITNITQSSGYFQFWKTRREWQWDAASDVCYVLVPGVHRSVDSGVTLANKFLNVASKYFWVVSMELAKFLLSGA